MEWKGMLKIICYPTSIGHRKSYVITNYNIDKRRIKKNIATSIDMCQKHTSVLSFLYQKVKSQKNKLWGKFKNESPWSNGNI